MPTLFQNTNNTAPRSRRARGESESRRSNGQRMDSGSRRPKETTSRNPDRRSPPSKSTSPSASMYSQPNITHDAAQISASSGEDSPVSPRSPDLRPDMRSGQTYGGPAGFFQLTSEPQTPAALLQYLDTEDEDAPPEPLGKSKTDGAIRSSVTPTLRPQPTTIQQHRERDISSASVPQIRKEMNEVTLRPRAYTNRQRPQSAFIQHFTPIEPDQDEVHMSEPETTAKQAVAASRYRRQIQHVPGTFGDSSTDGTESTDGTDGTSDGDDDEDYQTATPRPVNQGPSFPPASSAVVASAATQASAPRLERTATVLPYQEAQKTNNSSQNRKQDIDAALPKPSNNFAKGAQVSNVLQFLQADDDLITPTQEKKSQPQQQQEDISSESKFASMSSAKPQQSISSQYFATQRKINHSLPPRKESSEPGAKSASTTPPISTASSTLATANPPPPIPALSQASVLQYLEKEEKASASQPITREPSHKGVRSPEASRPPLSSAAAAYLEKTPISQPIQREPSNKGVRSPSMTRPPMPSASAAYFEKVHKVQPSAQQGYPQPLPQQGGVTVEPALKSPTITHRPLSHVFPAQHFYENSIAQIQQPRQGLHENASPAPSMPPFMSPQMQYTGMVPSAPPSAMASRPLTPESSDVRDDSETITGGSPAHMSMSMPHLSAAGQVERMPDISRAYTPPTFPPREADPSRVMHPMPMYPYSMQDPRAYYSSQYQNMQQGSPYMVEPQYHFQPNQHQPAFYAASPDPHQRHRLSLASVGGESRYTPEARHTPDTADLPRSMSQTRVATGRTSPQDEGAELLSRIQHALPDLQLLLNRCEEVTGFHKEPVKQITAGPEPDVVHQEALRQKSVRIEELEKELQTNSETHVTERNKMRFEIGNLQEQYRDLQDELVTIQRRRQSADQNPAQLEAFRKDVNGLRDELESSLNRQRELLEAKKAADQTIISLEAQLRALEAEMDVRKLAEAGLRSRLNETLSAHSRERDALAAQGKTEQRQLEDKQYRDRQDLEMALQDRESKHEETRKAWAKEKEEMQRAWQKEREDLQKTSQKDRDELAKTHSREKDDLVRGHSKDRDDLQKTHTREKDDLVRAHEDTITKLKSDADKDARGAVRRHEKALTELERSLEAKFDDQAKDLESENGKLRRDYKRVKRDWHLDKERGREEREKLRAAAIKMQTEHGSLMKLLEAFSEPTERDREREEKRERREKEQHGKKDDASMQG